MWTLLISLKIAKLQSCKLRILLPCAININLVNKAWEYVQSEIEDVKILQLGIYFQQMKFGRSCLKPFSVKISWCYSWLLHTFSKISASCSIFFSFFVITDTGLYSLMPHLWTSRKDIPRGFAEWTETERGEYVYVIDGLE